jgi:hypothetical protein
VAKGLLDTAGINSFLVDEHLVRIDWFWSNLIGGVKLCVHEQDEESALDILDNSFSPRLEVEGAGIYEQPSCPKCDSQDIEFQPIKKGIGLVSAWVIGVPLPIQQQRWKCNNCGHSWPASATEEGETEPNPTT